MFDCTEGSRIGLVGVPGYLSCRRGAKGEQRRKVSLKKASRRMGRKLKVRLVGHKL